MPIPYLIRSILICKQAVSLSAYLRLILRQGGLGLVNNRTKRCFIMHGQISKYTSIKFDTCLT
jgi:hypothetical protein